MELPVGDFINDALTSEVPEVSREILISNVRDEENHDLALSYIADAYGVDPKAEKEAMALTKSVGVASRSHGTQSNGCRACDFLCSTPILSI